MGFILASSRDSAVWSILETISHLRLIKVQLRGYGDSSGGKPFSVRHEMSWRNCDDMAFDLLFSSYEQTGVSNPNHFVCKIK